MEKKIKCPKCGCEVEKGPEVCPKCKELIKDYNVYNKMLKELEKKM